MSIKVSRVFIYSSVILLKLTDYVHFKELNVCVASHSTHMEVTGQPGIGSLLT